jgi:hypothetical protein
VTAHLDSNEVIIANSVPLITRRRASRLLPRPDGAGPSFIENTAVALGLARDGVTQPVLLLELQISGRLVDVP